MFYSFTIYTAAAQAYLQTRMKLAFGVIHLVEIEFPPGPQGTLFVWVTNSLHQVWPTNSNNFFNSDNFTIRFREHYPLLTEPYELQAWTFNSDADNSHEVTIRIGVLPVEVEAPWLLPYDERIRKMSGG